MGYINSAVTERLGCTPEEGRLAVVEGFARDVSAELATCASPSPFDRD